MASDARYVAHAARIDGLRRVETPLLREYCMGYRAGMIRWRAREQHAAVTDAESRARDRLAREALRGRVADRLRAAQGCGYHDGQVWWDVTQHRGLVRLAIVAYGGSARAFAREVWGVDEGSVRQMLAGTRPVPADRYTQLLDLIGAGLAASAAGP